MPRRTGLKPIFYDALIVACVSADVGLILFLMQSLIFPGLSVLFLFLTPVVVFAAEMIAAQRKTLFQKKPKETVLLKTGPLFQPEVLPESQIDGEKKKFKPSPTPKPKLDFAMHNCPEHGPERCAGNYMNLHSCNSASTSGKQIYWEERTDVSPRKQKRVNDAAVL